MCSRYDFEADTGRAESLRALKRAAEEAKRRRCRGCAHWRADRGGTCVKRKPHTAACPEDVCDGWEAR